jgi:heterocycloanthracin/sonorensin family bacteriocin
LNLIIKYKGEEKMQNFQNDLQTLGMDHFQVGQLIPIDPQSQDLRMFGGMRCGGMRCGGMRCGGFRCGGFGGGGFGCGGFGCGGFGCGGFGCGGFGCAGFGFGGFSCFFGFI